MADQPKPQTARPRSHRIESWVASRTPEGPGYVTPPHTDGIAEGPDLPVAATYATNDEGGEGAGYGWWIRLHTVGLEGAGQTVRYQRERAGELAPRVAVPPLTATIRGELLHPVEGLLEGG